MTTSTYQSVLRTLTGNEASLEESMRILFSIARHGRALNCLIRDLYRGPAGEASLKSIIKNLLARNNDSARDEVLSRVAFIARRRTPEKGIDKAALFKKLSRSSKNTNLTKRWALAMRALIDEQWTCDEAIAIGSSIALGGDELTKLLDDRLADHEGYDRLRTIVRTLLTDPTKANRLLLDEIRETAQERWPQSRIEEAKREWSLYLHQQAKAGV